VCTILAPPPNNRRLPNPGLVKADGALWGVPSGEISGSSRRKMVDASLAPAPAVNADAAITRLQS
jgi:hypothetical protein